MKYSLFYASIFIGWVVFFFSYHRWRPGLPHIIIGLATVGYSMTYETILGVWGRLYYYLDPVNSPLYITIASVLIYPVINMLYTLFLPPKRVLSYTLLWIMGMLLFEWFGVSQGIVVFTGWKVIPWSIVTYIVTYLWVYALYQILKKRLVSA